MGFFSALQERIRHQRLQKFDDGERRALLAFCHHVATADGFLKGEEVDVEKAVAKDLGVDLNSAVKLNLKEAIETLKKRPGALEAATLVVVDIVFADGAYSAGERAFVEKFAEKFGLPQATLKEAVDRRARATVDAALDEWHHDIVKG